MKKLNAHEIGLILGVTFGVFHAFWAVLVMLGWATGLLDFIFSLHFLDNPYTLQPFDLGRAVMLIVVTAAVGYAVGYLFAMIWNMMGKRK